MFGWMDRKATEGRMRRCLEELGQVLEQASEVDRVLIHMNSAQWLAEFSKAGMPLRPTEDPHSIAPKYARQMYKALERNRDDGLREMAGYRANLKRIGVEETDILDRTEMHLRRGLEMQMISVGVGALPDTLLKVSLAWAMLNSVSDASVKSAVAYVRSMERLGGVTGSPSPLSYASDRELHTMSNHLPAFAIDYITRLESLSAKDLQAVLAAR